MVHARVTMHAPAESKPVRAARGIIAPPRLGMGGSRAVRGNGPEGQLQGCMVHAGSLLPKGLGISGQIWQYPVLYIVDLYMTQLITDRTRSTVYQIDASIRLIAFLANGHTY